MNPASSSDAHPLLRKLESIVDLSPEETEALARIPMTVRELKADQDIVRDQDRPSQCCLLLEGFAFRYKIMEGGKRQIFSFHIPGDIPDLQSIHLSVMDHSLATLVSSKVGFITHDTIRGLIRSHPRMGEVFWRDTLIDAAVFREWMIGLGRRSAYTRIAHLLCEMFVRLRVIGLTEGNTCELPVTQSELGDALGLSTVHVNRTLQELRANRLVNSPRTSVIAIDDWEGLQKAGEFDSTYLHLQKTGA